ncbi:AraC family transcriptional regulator [[Ruminococcus] torques]|uniref:AraC family transcriptional regulator n=1 Tax=[Ruminococcus] torques TaxID=33039 RepID=UPI00242FBE4E|nr:AraC family transcriptional regulator [[Ruminococcus] torques]
MGYLNNKELFYQEFLNRENNKRHHKYDEEMLQYDLLKAGDINGLRRSMQMWTSALPGHLCDDVLRNYKYMFVASITLVTRFAIEGGMDDEMAYNISDLYIQKMDKCTTKKELDTIYEDMWIFFTNKMSEIHKFNIYSKPILKCIDYIHNRLHEQLTIKELADLVNLNPNYLSALFKRETGQSITEYIRNMRLDAAKNMLKYSDISYAEIASILNFSSQSHFTKVFREKTGYTPKEYRQTFYRSAFDPHDDDIRTKTVKNNFLLH